MDRIQGAGSLILHISCLGFFYYRIHLHTKTSSTLISSRDKNFGVLKSGWSEERENDKSDQQSAKSEAAYGCWNELCKVSGENREPRDDLAPDGGSGK